MFGYSETPLDRINGSKNNKNLSVTDKTSVSPDHFFLLDEIHKSPAVRYCLQRETVLMNVLKNVLEKRSLLRLLMHPEKESLVVLLSVWVDV